MLMLPWYTLFRKLSVSFFTASSRSISGIYVRIRPLSSQAISPFSLIRFSMVSVVLLLHPVLVTISAVIWLPTLGEYSQRLSIIFHSASLNAFINMPPVIQSQYLCIVSCFIVSCFILTMKNTCQHKCSTSKHFRNMARKTQLHKLTSTASYRK